jgi:cell division protein ZapA (FtsZ GTPase activity inhibitor)
MGGGRDKGMAEQQRKNPRKKRPESDDVEFPRLLHVIRQFLGTEEPIQELNELASSLIMRFVSPLLEKTHEIPKQRVLIMLGITVWNASLAPDRKQEQMRTNVLEAAKGRPEGVAQLEQIWCWLLNRKQTDFANHRIYIIDFELVEKQGTVSVEVLRSVGAPFNMEP